MSDFDLLRAIAPPVEPAPADVVLRARGRLARAQAGRTGHRRARRGLVLGPVALAASVAIAIFVTQLGSGEHTRAFAAEAVRMAQESPRLLVNGDGWKVTRVDEWSAGTGEMTFAAGDRELELHWWPKSQDGDQGPSSKDSDLDMVASVLGTHVAVHRYTDTNDYFARWHDGDTTVQARGLASSPADFIALLHRFEKVDPNTWLSAMPASAVTPGSHADAVTEMLKGIPVPPALDVAKLRSIGGGATRDRYQLGAQVSGAVACAWIAQWVHAKRTGDNAAIRQAADALATSRQWPILREMNRDGDYPEVVWQFADAVAADRTVTMGKLGMTVASTADDALGCPSP